MKLSPDSRFLIRKSFPGTGHGLFAVYALDRDEFVLEYVGEKVPTGTAEDAGSRYLFQLDDEWTIDGPVPGNIAGYLQHACEPNCEAREENGRIMIYTNRAVASGEELTIDYGQEYFDKFIGPAGCKCRTCINVR